MGSPSGEMITLFASAQGVQKDKCTTIYQVIGFQSKLIEKDTLPNNIH